jgi:tetratricopeptide (TPR) repeat protein
MHSCKSTTFDRNLVLVITRKIGDRQGEAEFLINVGRVYRRQGQYQQAMGYEQQSLVIFRELGHRRGEAKSLGNLGFSYYQLGQYQQARTFYSLEQYQKAIKWYQQSIKVIESIQGDLKIEELKTSFAAQQIHSYEQLIALLVGEGRFEEVFNYVERSRAFLRRLEPENRSLSSLRQPEKPPPKKSATAL